MKEWKFAHPGEARNAGYRRVGNEYVRIDLAERVIKKAHEARGQSNNFSMDMAFATSLGLSDAGLKALMRDAGFRHLEAPAEKAGAPEEADAVVAETVVSEPEKQEAAIPDQAGGEASALENDPVVEMLSTAPVPSINLTHWRWVGLPKPRPQEQRSQRTRPVRSKSEKTPKAKSMPERAPTRPKESAPPSALALQLAALKGLKL